MTVVVAALYFFVSAINAHLYAVDGNKTRHLVTSLVALFVAILYTGAVLFTYAQ